MKETVRRCPWAREQNALYVQYHDEQWGVPVHDDRVLFEMLILEGAQAGLSWETILKKRESYRDAFDGFDPRIVAQYTEEKEAELLQNPLIVRNHLKIKSAIRNANIFLGIQKEFGSFDRYLWGFTGNVSIKGTYDSFTEIPVKTELSDTISADLKKRGMNFVGSTIVYAYLQAVGVVNDHLKTCFRYNEV